MKEEEMSDSGRDVLDPSDHSRSKDGDIILSEIKAEAEAEETEGGGGMPDRGPGVTEQGAGGGEQHGKDECSEHTENNDETDESLAKSFPHKLWDILSNDENTDIISWLPHGKGFIIHKKKAFATDILPKHFKASKFTSFTRKLNRWGFSRAPRGPETGAYFHKLFCRDKPELSHQMTSNSGNKYQSAPQQGQHLLPACAPMMMGVPAQMPFYMPSTQMAMLTPQQQQVLWQQQMQLFQFQQMQMMQYQYGGSPPPHHPMMMMPQPPQPVNAGGSPEDAVNNNSSSTTANNDNANNNTTNDAVGEDDKGVHGATPEDLPADCVDVEHLDTCDEVGV